MKTANYNVAILLPAENGRVRNMQNNAEIKRLARIDAIRNKLKTLAPDELDALDRAISKIITSQIAISQSSQSEP